MDSVSASFHSGVWFSSSVHEADHRGRPAHPILVRLKPSAALDLLLRQHAQDMLDTVPLQHGLLPTLEVWIFRRVPGILCVFQDERDLSVPHDKGEIRVRALVAHEPGAAGQMGVEDGSHTVDLVGVAFAGGREGLWVEDVEPVGSDQAGLVRWLVSVIRSGTRLRHTRLPVRSTGLGPRLGSRPTAAGGMSRGTKRMSMSLTCRKS